MNNLVEINNNQVVVSSRQIAENFGKEHKDVLDSIRLILAAENSAARFFFETTYENRGKQYPEYLMNRDGFSLLVMGFTGSKALEWKVKYIQAFVEMELELKTPRAVRNYLAMSEEDRAISYFRAKKENTELDRQVKASMPSVKFVEKYVNAEYNTGIREVAKILHITEREFVNWLLLPTHSVQK